LPESRFDRSVFINCPFDEDFEPILQAILFCIIYLGFYPRLARERSDSGESRLEKIKELIESSLYSIHDLSRCQAKKEGEIFRLNMPFELGLDYGCKQYFGRGREAKKILILEEKPYRYQAALSDISGCDIEYHEGNYQKVIRKIRNWLVSEAAASPLGAQHILQKYEDFQEWNYKTKLSSGFSEEDIRDYPTKELLDAMRFWVSNGEPV